ncbi:protein kinase domain-containing protein [Tolypothrix sp. VBCCA 56010]|uniref:protein kinase domain-containing protein n=1 Tax=Tolypothrix sp. VBCCA 56010 TaxID=3137731 RepID=UPI003D7D5AA1
MQPPITVGTVLQNRYRITQILGQGGFGRTYLAEDQRRFNELCAIKELIPTATGTGAWEKAQELFAREAAILYQIQHPQIPQFRERFEEDQRLFLVQDYVAGKTYRAILDDRKAVGQSFTEAEVLQLMRSLLPVLEHIHGRGIIHRDISPENIILRESDRLPVLIDFGVVKELATKLQSLNASTPVTTVGKLGYAPSEQMQTGRAYPSSDLYALAVTVLVLLTGKEPQELFDENQLTWNWQKLVKVDPRFAQILNRMLSHSPSDRFHSVADLTQALQVLGQPNQANPPLSNMQTVAVGGRPDPIPPVAPKRLDPVIPDPPSNSILDNPLALGAIGSAVIILAGVGSWAIVSSIRSQPKTLAPETPPQTFPSPVITGNATPTPTFTPTPTPTNVEPIVTKKRLTFVTPNQLNLDGTIKANEIVEYSFFGRKGSKLIASLSPESKNVLLTVLSPNRQAIDNSAQQVTSYEGILPESGRYIIQLTAPEVPESNYVLNAGLENLEPTPTITPTLEPTFTPTPESTPTPTITPTLAPTFPAPPVNNSPTLPPLQPPEFPSTSPQEENNNPPVEQTPIPNRN